MPDRFFIFIGPNYYPNGGADDFYSTAPTLEEAIEIAKLRIKTDFSSDWAHVAELVDNDLIRHWES